MKTLQEREQELNAMAQTDQGKYEIGQAYKKAIGIGPGDEIPVGTMLRQEMIPAILKHEYPNG